MIAKRQIWNYSDKAKVWAGKYRNSHNLLHWHYDCELVYVERGSIDIFCEKHRYTLKEGQSLFVDSGQMHYQRANDPDTVLLVIVFDYNLIPAALQGYQLESPLIKYSYRIPHFYQDLRNILTAKKPFFAAEAGCRATQFMIELFRGETLIPRVGQDKRAETFKKLLEVVEEKFGEYSFADAVDFMGMSDAYFSRYFKSATGTTFSQYLNYIRVDNAIRILQRDPSAPMTEIAEHCGFATIRNFNRIFKELTGFAPSRLPRNYSLDDKFSYPSDKLFNPTLYDCEMIESSEEMNERAV